MIQIKAYKNGYIIKGHADVVVCHQVSLWHWITSNLLLGFRKNAAVKEYTSNRDNPGNPMEGLSYVIFNYQDTDMDWILGDCIISLEGWIRDTPYCAGNVQVERIDGLIDTPKQEDLLA